MDKIKKQGENSTEKQKVPLVKITARISEKVDGVMRELAEEFGVPFSQVVRLAIDGHLENYLEKVQYMDSAQGDKIREQCAALGNELQAIRNELHRIGVNVNQVAKWRNVDALMYETMQATTQSKDVNERRELVARYNELKRRRSTLNLDDFRTYEMEILMQRYEQATGEVAKALWRIQG